jgi:hydroxypyruvate reductase
MTQGLEEVLGEHLTGGVVTVKYEHLAPVSRVTIHEAAHPVPDAAGMRARLGTGARDLLAPE